MDEQFTEHFNQFAYERIQDIIVKSRDNDPYKPLWDDLKRASSAVQKVLDGLSQEDQQTITDYLSALHACHDYENSAIYVSGLRDCARFLREIGII